MRGRFLCRASTGAAGTIDPIMAEVALEAWSAVIDVAKVTFMAVVVTRAWKRRWNVQNWSCRNRSCWSWRWRWRWRFKDRHRSNLMDYMDCNTKRVGELKRHIKNDGALGNDSPSLRVTSAAERDFVANCLLLLVVQVDRRCPCRHRFSKMGDDILRALRHKVPACIRNSYTVTETVAGPGEGAFVGIALVRLIVGVFRSWVFPAFIDAVEITGGAFQGPYHRSLPVGASSIWLNIIRRPRGIVYTMPLQVGRGCPHRRDGDGRSEDDDNAKQNCEVRSAFRHPDFICSDESCV